MLKMQLNKLLQKTFFVTYNFCFFTVKFITFLKNFNTKPQPLHVKVYFSFNRPLNFKTY